MNYLYHSDSGLSASDFRKCLKCRDILRQRWM